ncbi:ATP F0F1 synthase subunit C, partial [Campylobacter upsaliensis]|nr:ATP F0F1 synthase subunit C [Campylobacter upsaliensis]
MKKAIFLLFAFAAVAFAQTNAPV